MLLLLLLLARVRARARPPAARAQDYLNIIADSSNSDNNIDNKTIHYHNNINNSKDTASSEHNSCYQSNSNSSLKK